jgi:hypothetical protein
MAFGQQSGSPASGKDVAELLRLLQEVGHSGFRDARGPMGFTQRQAGGKFTREEVATYIEQMQAAADGTGPVPAAEAVVTSKPAAKRAPAVKKAAAGEVLSAMDQTMRRFPTEKLAAELQRRGWIVVEP